MTDDVLQNHLDEAITKINALPESQRGPLLALVQETRERHTQLRENFSRISDAMDEWRVTVQYLLFDREASQRELAELRRRMGDQKS